MTSHWGAETTGTVISYAKQWLAKHGGADGPIGRYLEDTGLGNSPAVLVTMAFAKEGLFALSLAEAQAGIAAILADPNDYGKPFHRADHKRHGLAVARMTILHRIADGGSPSMEQQLNAAARTPKAPVQEPRVQTGHTSSATVRSEVQKMLA